MAKIGDTRHRQIRRQIENEISRGVWAVGQRIPGERDLAKTFEVSQMTVNRAVQDLVRDGLLERRMGSGTYVCGPLQTEPVPQKRLVLVVPYTDHPEDDVYLRSPFQSICSEVSRASATLQVVQASEDHYPDVVDDHSGAAFIFAAPPDGAKETLVSLHSHSVPFVVMGASWTDTEIACVDSDNISGAKRATEYLIRLGHQRIGFLDGDPCTTNCRDRLSGYQLALTEGEIEPSTSWIAQAGGDWEIDASGRSALTDMLLGKDSVTAIIGASFYLSLHLLKLISSLRLRVPEDVSVISLDDSSTAEHLAQPLTAMRQPLSEMGLHAARLALSMLETTESDSSFELLPMELIVRSSCDRYVGHATTTSHTTSPVALSVAGSHSEETKIQ